MTFEDWVKEEEKIRYIATSFNESSQIAMVLSWAGSAWDYQQVRKNSIAEIAANAVQTIPRLNRINDEQKYCKAMEALNKIIDIFHETA